MLKIRDIENIHKLMGKQKKWDIAICRRGSNKMSLLFFHSKRGLIHHFYKQTTKSPTPVQQAIKTLEHNEIRWQKFCHRTVFLSPIGYVIRSEDMSNREREYT